MNQLIDLERFRARALKKDPFPYLVVPGFVKSDALADVVRDFPPIAKRGSFPLTVLRYGGAFARLMEELKGSEMRDAFAEKFELDLSGRAVMITARGMSCPRRDGRIHTDSRSKIITVLLYLNPEWSSDGGRLRLLRSADLDDVVEEVPPDAGTLLAFLNTENAWHGHAPFSGTRRLIQLNWVTDQRVAEREQKRHGFAALLKRINPFS